MDSIRTATEELEEDDINIFDAIEMVEAMKNLFDEQFYIDSAKTFAWMREVDPEASLVKYHCRRLGLSRFDRRAQSKVKMSMF